MYIGLQLGVGGVRSEAKFVDGDGVVGIEVRYDSRFYGCQSVISIVLNRVNGSGRLSISGLYGRVILRDSIWT